MKVSRLSILYNNIEIEIEIYYLRRDKNWPSSRLLYF